LVIKWKKLHPDAKIPERGSAEAAGFDVYAVEDRTIFGSDVNTVPTGFALEIPVGYFAQVNPRTGLAVKRGITVLAGVIDSDYRGEVHIILGNIKNRKYHVRAGDRIAQLVFMPHVWLYLEGRASVPCIMGEGYKFEEVDELAPTQRDDGRFGSTGR